MQLFQNQSEKNLSKKKLKLGWTVSTEVDCWGQSLQHMSSLFIFDQVSKTWSGLHDGLWSIRINIALTQECDWLTFDQLLAINAVSLV